MRPGAGRANKRWLWGKQASMCTGPKISRFLFLSAGEEVGMVPGIPVLSRVKRSEVFPRK